MSAKVSPVASSADLGLPPKSTPAASTAQSGRDAPAQDPADLRLVIEKDKASGTYVYKTVDRRTGDVVQQFPNEQLLRLRQAESYEAGAVITAKA